MVHSNIHYSHEAIKYSPGKATEAGLWEGTVLKGKFWDGTAPKGEEVRDRRRLQRFQPLRKGRFLVRNADGTARNLPNPDFTVSFDVQERITDGAADNGANVEQLCKMS